jgi:hypothetical protein
VGKGIKPNKPKKGNVGDIGKYGKPNNLARLGDLYKEM